MGGLSEKNLQALEKTKTCKPVAKAGKRYLPGCYEHPVGKGKAGKIAITSVATFSRA